MTAGLQPEAKPSSRRAVLAGALGGLGALAASAIGRPVAVRANDPNDVVLGSSTNTATTLTKISNTSNGADVFEAHSGGAGRGVSGSSFSDVGVRGDSQTSYGVVGSSTSNAGVLALNLSTSNPALIGWSPGNNTGVMGWSNGASPPAGKSMTGVYGYAAGDIGAVGVWGRSGLGVGVRGTSSSSDGVVGTSNSSAKSGVWGDNSAGGYGVAGSSAGAAKAGVWGSNSGAGTGVRGTAVSGHGVHGQSASGFAGYFAGKVYVSRYQDMKEISTPSAPGANKARLFVRDNGSGKTQLCVRFNTGAIRVLATQA